MFLLVPIVLASEQTYTQDYNNYLTRSVTDTLYCLEGQNCTLSGLIVGNLTVYGDYLNVSVTNYNVTGDIDITNNINIGNDLIFSDGEYITSTAFDDLNIYADDDINLYPGGLLSIDGDVLPAVNMAHDIGSTGLMWNNIYASNFYDDGVLLVNIEADGIYLYNDSDTIYFNETKLNSTIETNAPSIEYFYNDSDTLYLNSSYFDTFNSKMFYANNSVVGETAVGYEYVSNISLGVGLDLNTDITGIKTNIEYTAEAGTFATPSINGIDIDINLIDNGAGLFLPSVKPVDIRVTADSTVALTDTLFNLFYSGGVSNNALQDGGLEERLEVSGTHGKVVGIKSAVVSSGTGDIYGYEGFSGTNAGFSGSSYGVKGQTALSGGTSITESAGFVSEPAKINSYGLQSDKIMTFKGVNGHIFNSGSLVLSNSISSNPSAISTDHLDFINNKGELYVEGVSEFDNMVYFDNNTYLNYSLTDNNATTQLCKALNGSIEKCSLPHLMGYATETQTVNQVDTWYNVTFNVSRGKAEGFEFINDANETLIIPFTGDYIINYGVSIKDASPAPTSTVAIRILHNGAELEDSYKEFNPTKQSSEEWLQLHFHGGLTAGDKVTMQYIADDTDVSVTSGCTYSNNCHVAYGFIELMHD